MDLNTAEKFVLIAHHPEKARYIISEIHVKNGVVGASLLEMSMEDIFKLENRRLVIKRELNLTNPISSAIYTQIVKSKKKRRLSFWLQRLSSKAGKYKWMILESLERKGLNKIENKRFLGLIPYRSSTLIESYKRDQLIQSLKQKVYNHKSIEDEDLTILALIDACNLYGAFAKGRSEKKAFKRALKEGLEKSSRSSSINSTIKEIQKNITNSIAATVVITAS